MASLASGFAVASNPVSAQAVAPEMFARQGDVSKMTDIGAVLSTVVANVPDGQANSDLDATVALAAASGDGDTDRLGRWSCQVGQWLETRGLSQRQARLQRRLPLNLRDFLRERGV